MKAVVFVGPSVPGSIEVGSQIAIRPPATAGDIYQVVRSGVGLIGLIDAHFEDSQTVLHDEILCALKDGVHVWGSASMGALRAVECAPFGMRGHGEIFEMYRDGHIDGDHEVAMQYGPPEIGSPALTVPLINVRATLTNAVGSGLLETAEANAVLSAASKLYYKDLTWSALLKALPCDATRLKLEKWLPGGYVDLKAKDARSLIELIQTSLADGLDRFAPSFEFQETVFWQSFVRVLKRATSTLSEKDTDVLDELRLDPLRYAETLQRAFARRAANAEFVEDVFDHQWSADEIRADLGLVTAASYADWLERNRTDESSLARFLSEDARLEGALEDQAASLATGILCDLRIENMFTALDERACAKRELMGDRKLANVPADYADFDLRDLLEWFCSSRRISGTFDNPDEAARSLGLPDRKALHVLLRREFEYSRILEEADAANGDAE